jgi:hypothetical protein
MVLKAFAGVVRVMSPAALKVALLVEVSAAACVIDPPVEVTDKTGAVPPARATLPPLVRVTVRVVVEGIIWRY